MKLLICYNNDSNVKFQLTASTFIFGLEETEKRSINQKKIGSE